MYLKYNHINGLAECKMEKQNSPLEHGQRMEQTRGLFCMCNSGVHRCQSQHQYHFWRMSLMFKVYCMDKWAWQLSTKCCVIHEAMNFEPIACFCEWLSVLATKFHAAFHLGLHCLIKYLSRYAEWIGLKLTISSYMQLLDLLMPSLIWLFDGSTGLFFCSFCHAMSQLFDTAYICSLIQFIVCRSTGLSGSLQSLPKCSSVYEIYNNSW